MQRLISRGSVVLALVLSCVCFSPPSALPQQEFPGGAPPETILGTFHVVKGHEEDIKKLMAQAWQTYLKLDYVYPQPHVALQGVEDGDQPYFVEVFTWKSADYPDHAPAEIQTIWKQMQAVCEKRDNKPAIEAKEMHLLVPRQPD